MILLRSVGKQLGCFDWILYYRDLSAEYNEDPSDLNKELLGHQNLLLLRTSSVTDICLLYGGKEADDV